MSDFYQKITQMQGTLEDLVRMIPGFKGYFAREDRRAADDLLRQHLVLLFEEQQREFTRLQQRLVEKTGLAYMERVQRIDTVLSTLIDRIRTAARGYAGMFDAVKMNEDALARLYAFDNSLLGYQAQFASGLKRLGESIETETVSEVLDQMEDLLAEARDTFDRRSEAVQELTAAK